MTAKPSPIFPSTATHLQSLAITMAVMCFLACLALVSLIIVQRATAAWSQGLASEATVQLRQISSVNEEQELAKVLTLLKSTPGVTTVMPLDRAAGAKLLEPWLGTVALGDLPIPRLIRIGLDEQHPPDFGKLEASLSQQVKGASLDTHRRWQTQLSRMGTSLIMVASLVLALIAAASIILVSNAAHGVMAANREIIDVLELIGAESRFISRQNDRQFFATGLTAALGGVAFALLTFVLVFLGGGLADDTFGATARSMLLSIGWRAAASLLLVPLVATLIAVWISRLTLLRHLRGRL